MEPAAGLRRIKLAPHQMTTRETSAEDLFVPAHLGVPRVDPAQWSLAIDGLVGRRRALSLGTVKSLPKRIVEAVHECCGNPLEPTVPTRRVANMRWAASTSRRLSTNSRSIPPRAFSGRTAPTAAVSPARLHGSRPTTCCSPTS
jgi:hypothetical protein